MQLTSDTFNDGDTLERAQAMAASFGFGCAGDNVSPQLSWTAGPEGTKSYTIQCYDPDAPTGSGFWHWVLVNIPADVTSLALGAGSENGSLPDGALQIRTDTGVPGYAGPCPPEGDAPHRYIFTVRAVDKLLEVEQMTPCAVVGFQLNYATLDQAAITGMFSR